MVAMRIPVFKTYTRSEFVADAWLHAVGVAAASAGAVALLIVALSQNSLRLGVALGIYALGLAATFAFSAAYNLVSRPTAKAVLRRLDHSAIFVMIAGTYTPFALVSLDGAYGLLGFVWAVAAVGVALKLFLPHRFETISVVLYLAQGWVVITAIDPLAEALPVPALVLLVTGGVIYTAGVVFHLWERLRYHNVIWHSFVLAAAACHYAAVIDAVALT